MPAADPVFFRDLAYVFAAAVLGGTLAWITRQPLILGYVVGGIVISPLTPGPSVSHTHTFELFAEIGVVLLMFSIGIEFSLKNLLRVKWVAVGGGLLGMALSIALGFGAASLLGLATIPAFIAGVVVSVASTMVLARLLMDRGELHSRHGRVMIGISLVEDLAVVVLIVLIPTLGAFERDRLIATGKALGTALAVVVPLLYLGARVVPRVLERVARTRNQELFLLVTLAIALGTAAVTQGAGLSLALGAFLGGLLISESDYAHETLARVLPLRDAFVALFFVTIGALINPATVVQNVPLLATLVGCVVAGNGIIWTVVVRVFGYPLRTAVLVGVGLTQIGELSFILIQAARSAGHVGDELYNTTLAASLLSILINAWLVRTAPRWIASTAPAPDPGARDVPAGAGHVVLCGFGRVGSAVGEAFETFGTRYVPIDVDPDVIKGLRARGVPALYGDASQRRLLEAAHVQTAALAVVALPDIERVHLAVRHIRAMNPRIPVLARAHEASARDRLLEDGATEVIQPEVEAASTLIRHALRRLSLPRESVLAYLERLHAALETATPAEAADGGPLPEIHEVTVGAGELADQSLGEAAVRERFGVTVIAIRRESGETVLQPSAATVLRPGDRVRVFGLPAQVRAFAAAARGG